MNNINLKLYNHYSVSEVIFDEIMVWAAKNRPSLNKESLIGDIEKILDKVEERGYDKGYESARIVFEK